MRKIYRSLVYIILFLLGIALIAVADTTPSISPTEPLERLLTFILGVLVLALCALAIWGFEYYLVETSEERPSTAPAV